MMSGKGFLYTVLAASSAAVLVGIMLTPKRKEPFRRLGTRTQEFFAAMKRRIAGAKSGNRGLL